MVTAVTIMLAICPNTMSRLRTGAADKRCSTPSRSRLDHARR